MSDVEAVTQRLRNLIEESRSGHFTAEDLHNELSNLEVAAKLPLTEPDPWFNMTPEQVAEYKAEERKTA